MSYERWLIDFDKYYKEQLYNDLSAFINNMNTNPEFSGLNLNPFNKKLKRNPRTFVNGDQVFVENIDIFNRLSINVDLDLIIIPEYIQIMDTNNFRGINTILNIDFDPLITTREAQVLVNHVLKYQDYGDNDNQGIYIGLELKLWRNFQIHWNTDNAIPNNDSVKCILFTKPTVKKVNTELDTYVRQSIFLNFVFVFNHNIEFYGKCVQF